MPNRTLQLHISDEELAERLRHVKPLIKPRIPQFGKVCRTGDQCGPRRDSGNSGCDRPCAPNQIKTQQHPRRGPAGVLLFRRKSGIA
ncbi:MAG: hypothetical protein MSB08_08650 [Subdoligranulum sp.]|nr:hypothetical protein [Subdoligranulum sp.]